jgi:hypothetical protein
MKKLIPLIAAYLMFNVQSSAQKNVVLTVKHMLGSEAFSFNQNASNDIGQTFVISRVDYYMSQFTLIHDGGQETPVSSDVYILAKGTANVVANLGIYDVETIEGIKFHIGVESPTNTSDPSVWPSQHPLAPQAPSMHWGWTAGYRFVALEGRAGQNLNIGYEMHGLWDRNYFEQTIMLSGSETNEGVFIHLDADYTQALKGINLNAGPIDHGADASDLTVMENFRDYVFSPGVGFPSNINESNSMGSFSIYPNPSNGEVQIRLEKLKSEGGNIAIYSIDGRLIEQINFVSTSNYSFNGLSRGIYLVKIQLQNGVSLSEKLIVQ